MPATGRNSKAVECSVCRKVISRKADLPRHMRTHAENKEALMHACPYDGCDYRTLQKSNVQTHIRTHTRERSKTCPHPECPFCTTDPGSLTRHRKSEHGYKPKARRIPDDKAARKDAAAPYPPTTRIAKPEVSRPAVRSRHPSPATPNSRASSRYSPWTDSSPISLRRSPSPYVVSPLSSPSPPRTTSNLQPSPPISPLSTSSRSYSPIPRGRTFTISDYSLSPSPSPMRTYSPSPEPM